MLRASVLRRQIGYRNFSAHAVRAPGAAALPPTPPHEEVRVKLAGLEIAGRSFGDPSSPRKLLGAHGWMDNALTHSHTASAWTSQGFHFISLDLPGHGHSGHRALADTYAAGGYALAVMEVARALGWDSFALCAHSMGAGISSMVAGALGDQISALCVLEGIGMNTKAESLSASGLRQAVEGRASLLARQGKTKTYASRKDAALARVATVRRYPGNQHISWHAASTLVERGTIEVDASSASAAGTAAGSGASDGAAHGSVRFSHDSRLMEPSPTFLSEAQMLDYLKRVSAPTLCVTSTGGWPWPAGVMLGRIVTVPDMEHHHVLGGHHAHLDDDEHGAALFHAIIGDWVRRRLPDIDARIEAAAAKARAKHGHGHGHGHGKASHAPAAAAAGSSAGAAARPVYHPAGVTVDSSSASLKSAPASAAATAAAVGRGLRKVNPTAGAGEDVEADADVAAAAQSIASSATVAADSPASSAGSAAAAGGQGRPGAGPAHALFTDKHVFVAESAPFSAATDVPAAEAAAAVAAGQLRVHGYDTGLRIVKANSSSPALYTWPNGNSKSGGYAPLPQAGAAPASPSERTALTWTRLPDHLVGLPHARTLRNNGGAALAGLQLGAWAPRIFLETMPTLEAVTVAAAAAQGGPGGAQAALEANTKALEARGSSY